jgi:ribonuclease Y
MDGYRKLLNGILAPETEEEQDAHDTAMEELERREIELDEREYELDERERLLDERESALNIREENLDEREAELDAIEDEEPQTDNIFRDIDYGKVKGLVTNILGMLGGRE